MTKSKIFLNALNESGQIFGQNDPQNFWKTQEAGAKKEIFLPFWLLWSHNLGTSKLEQGWIHGNPVADRWAGAVLQKLVGIQIRDRRTDGRTDGPTNTARCRVACPQLKKERRKENNIETRPYTLPLSHRRLGRSRKQICDVADRPTNWHSKF